MLIVEWLLISAQPPRWADGGCPPFRLLAQLLSRLVDDGGQHGQAGAVLRGLAVLIDEVDGQLRIVQGLLGVLCSWHSRELFPSSTLVLSRYFTLFISGSTVDKEQAGEQTGDEGPIEQGHHVDQDPEGGFNVHAAPNLACSWPPTPAFSSTCFAAIQPCSDAD